MEKRKLGSSEIYVKPVGLGCMGFSHASGDPLPADISIRTLREAYESSSPNGRGEAVHRSTAFSSLDDLQETLYHSDTGIKKT